MNIGPDGVTRFAITCAGLRYGGTDWCGRMREDSVAGEHLRARIRKHVLLQCPSLSESDIDRVLDDLKAG